MTSSLRLPRVVRARALVRIACVAALLASAPSSQEHAARSTGITRHTVDFRISYTVNDPGLGVFLLGDVPELASGDLRRALPMYSSNGSWWKASVSLPVDTGYTYRFYLRSTGNTEFKDPTNGVPISEPVSVESARPGSKTVRFYSALPDPVVKWRAGTRARNAYESAHAVRIGAGRNDGEALFEARFARATDEVQFFVRGIAGGREPATGVYTTRLATLFVQDENVFSYAPAPSVPGPRRVLPMRMSIDSDVLGVTRHYRVMLPRGYDVHPDRRYPVLYFYDGEKAWEGNGLSTLDPGGRVVERLIQKGQVGELIMVAMDTPGYPGGRPEDTIPSDDYGPFGGPRGSAHDFLRFVGEELKVAVDARFRTLPGREHTFLSGFSLGGLLATVAGWDAADTFGGVGAQSPSLWAAPNFVSRLAAGATSDTRFYLDAGDLETGLTSDAIRMVARLVRMEFAYAANLEWRVGFGQTHTYANARTRLEPMLEFLYPAVAEEHAR